MERVAGVARDVMLKDLSNPGKAALVPLQLEYLGLHGPLGPGYQSFHQLTEER